MSNDVTVTNQSDAYFYYVCNTSSDFSWFLGGNVSSGAGSPITNNPCPSPAGSPPVTSAAKPGVKKPAAQPPAPAPAKKP